MRFARNAHGVAHSNSAWLAAALALWLAGCGVRQFNGKLIGEEQQSRGQLVNAYAPFSASGQNGNSMLTSPTGCGASRSLTGRPCVKAKASVGVPWGYDRSTSSTNGYATVAGPGRTMVASGPKAPEHPRMDNRDLNLLKRQTRDKSAETLPP